MTDIDITQWLRSFASFMEREAPNPKAVFPAQRCRECADEIERLRSAGPEGEDNKGRRADDGPHPDEPVIAGNVISADLLERIRAYLRSNHDVVDSPSGPQPNEAMGLDMELAEVMGERP